MPVHIHQDTATTLSVAETIPASDSIAVVIGDFGEFLKGDFQIALYNTPESKYRGLLATVVKQTAGLSDSIYGKIGDSLEVSLSFSKIGSEVVLGLTNTEIFDVILVMESTILLEV